MIIKTISCKRIKNLGNYQNETVEAIAELDDNENADDAMHQLRQFVEDSLERKLESDDHKELANIRF